MKIEITKEEGNKLNFALAGVGTHFANAMRRYAMSAVPVMAIDDITLYENTSAFFDEYVAHRIGLIPILTPSGVPAEAETTFYLDVKGPKIVYSSELESKDKEIKVARDKIPIVTLVEGQSIRLEGKANLATSKKHAKYQPGLAAYEITKDGYKFVVESFFQMPPRELLVRAAAVLESDLEDVEKQLGKAKKKK